MDSPVQVGFSDKTAAEKLKASFEAGGVTHETFEYPGKAHAFMNETEESHARLKAMGVPDSGLSDSETSALAWGRVCDLFGKNLE